MRVRKAKQGDVPSIAGVHVTAWQACYRGIMPDEFLDRLSVSDREPIWHRELGATNRLVLVARSQRKTLGFTACGPSRDQDKDATLVAEVYAIYVLPDLWGQGCGYSLWRRAEKELVRAKFAELNVWVLAANERARNFYEREGCQLDSTTSKDAHVGAAKLPEVRYSKRLHHR